MDLEDDKIDFMKHKLHFNGGEPKYDLYYKKLEVLESICSIANSVAFVHDLDTRLNPYFSNFPIYLTGYSKEELAALGVDLFSKIFEYKDLLFFSMIGEKMYNVIQSISPERRVHFVLTLSINLEHKDGHKVPVNIYLTPFLFDDNDNMWMLLGRISFSPKHYKNQHILYIDLLDSNERYLLNESRDDFEMTTRPMLTHMEKSVLILCTRGYLQKEVAESLKISINTVKTHKRNLLRKLEADNVSEAYIMSTIHKLL